MTRYCPSCQVTWTGTPACWVCGRTTPPLVPYVLAGGTPVRVVDWRNAWSWTAEAS